MIFMGLLNLLSRLRHPRAYAEHQRRVRAQNEHLDHHRRPVSVVGCPNCDERDGRTGELAFTPDPTFLAVVAGDVVVRMLAGVVRMELVVDRVDETLIHAKGGWTFDRQTGAEVDEDLGWGPQHGVTGSFLIHEDGLDTGQ